MDISYGELYGMSEGEARKQTVSTYYATGNITSDRLPVAGHLR